MAGKTNVDLSRDKPNAIYPMILNKRINVVSNNLRQAKKLAKDTNYKKYVGVVFKATKTKKGMYQFVRIKK